jgi:hypothetical protein
MAIQRTIDYFDHPRRQYQGGIKRKASEMILSASSSSSGMLSSTASSSLLKKKPRCGKSLRFNEFSTVAVLPLRSKEDRLNSWYMRQEISAFKRSTTALADALKDTRTAKAMKHIAASIEHRSTPPRPNIHGKEVIRGIEHMIAPEVSRHMLRRRKRTIHGVLKGQAHLDHEKLAQAYRASSVFAKEWTALITNFQDERK